MKFFMKHILSYIKSCTSNILNKSNTIKKYRFGEHLQ